MLWVYIIAAVGLVGIMVETWLSYRKEAAHQKKVLARAAKQLGISRRTLSSRLNQLAIPRPRKK